jgi:hypothetical protein
MMFFKIVIFSWVKISFIEKQKNDVDDVISSSLNVCWASTSNSLNVVYWIFLKFIECQIDFVRHMFEILFFFCYFVFALKWSNRMIIFAINTFFLVDEYLARWFIMRFDTNWTSLLMSTNLVDVIISLIIKTLFNSIIVNKQFARNLRILVQKIVFY